MNKTSKKEKNLKLTAVLQSVLAAAFGVQSRDKKERDFREGRASHFLIAGFLFTVLLIAVLLGVVYFIVP